MLLSNWYAPFLHGLLSFSLVGNVFLVSENSRCASFYDQLVKDTFTSFSEIHNLNEKLYKISQISQLTTPFSKEASNPSIDNELRSANI